MAVNFLNTQLSELCLGKPELKGVSSATTISDALTTLKRSGESHVSVWSIGVCVGKVSLADVILFLCGKENFGDLFKAFESPVSDLLPKGCLVVRHLEPNSSLLEAIDYILEGIQNLVIPIRNHYNTNSRKQFINKSGNHGYGYCWLTQEDVIRFLLNSIGAFSAIPTLPINSLNIINHEAMSIHYDSPASSALTYFNRALAEQTSVAVVDEFNRLIGEISPFTLACCDETVAQAIMALSAGDLMAYIDCGGPPEDLVRLVKARLEGTDMGGLLDFVEEILGSSSSSSSSSCSSSDEESWSNRNIGPRGCYPGRRSEAIVCGPKSSLVAVMMQALTHRVSCVWVVEENCTLVGVVTFSRMLKVLRNGGTGERITIF